MNRPVVVDVPPSDRSRKFRIVEMFRTLQGEGAHAGRAAVFVRFTACNLWTGHDEHRVRDSGRSGALCPLWCDTDFRQGVTWTTEALVADVARLADPGVDLIVLTGGEPLLQVTRELVDALHAAMPFCTIAVETNGTIDTLGLGLDWVTLSPKVPADRLALQAANEIKVVFPDYDPTDYERFPAQFRWIQPRANTSSVGVSLIAADATARAAAFCIQNPRWRLGMQSHKVWGLP